eukprot:scaffold294812_cov30-Prasinocladus_malaysianus.AAC.1
MTRVCASVLNNASASPHAPRRSVLSCRRPPPRLASRLRAANVSPEKAVTGGSPRVEDLKLQILQHSSTVDRGQLHDRLVSKAYEGKRQQLRRLIGELCDSRQPDAFKEEDIEGEWELVYSTCQLFRSSPFFMAIQAAFNDTRKSSLFFKLHDLQVKSWGTSTVGRVAQRVDFSSRELRSEFDTIIFALTVIPIIGWFKLLPTFGGRVISFASDLSLDPDTGRMDMVLQRTRVDPAPGTVIVAPNQRHISSVDLMMEEII